MSTNVERELGKLTEAVEGLRRDRENDRDETRLALASISGKLDTHVANYTSLKVDVAKVTATLSIIVTLSLGLVKEAWASMFKH